jgi:superfamily II DNA or RNA helicase
MRDDLSNALLKGVTGEVIFKITTQELIKLGYLTPPKIIFTKVRTKGSYEDPITQQEMKRPSAMKWADLYDYAIVKNPRRNKAIAEIITNIHTPAIVLVKRLDHIRYINHYLTNPIPFIKGTSTTGEREDAKKKLVSGEYKILCATTIFDEGVDIPEIRAIIMAGGGKSDIKTMQRLGRGLRISQNKYEVMIYDFIDQSEDAPGWVPAKHSRDRMLLFKKEGFDIVQR